MVMVGLMLVMEVMVLNDSGGAGSRSGDGIEVVVYWR